MHFDDTDFINLLEKVEKAGGSHYPDRCSSRKYSFTGDKMPPQTLPGCGQHFLLEVPYDPRETVYVSEPVLIEDPDNPDGARISKKEQVGTDKHGNAVYAVVTNSVACSGENAQEPGRLVVCAYHDAVSAWPRFQ